MAENSVFISYSTQDADNGRKLYNALTAQDRTLWMDWKSIALTADWWNEIKDGIETSDNFVFLISPNSIASPICHLEVQYACSLNKRMIPVLITQTDERAAYADLITRDMNELQRALLGKQDVIDLARDNWKTLSSIQWINLARDGFDAGFAQLVEAIDTDLDYIAEHTRLLLRAKDWNRRGKTPSLLLRGDDLTSAEAWLKTAESMKPPANDDHRAYIAESRKDEDQRARLAAEQEQRTRTLRRATLIAGVVGVVALTLAVLSGFNAREAQARADIAGTQVADANATLTPIPGTLAAANEQIVAANTAQYVAEVRAAEANTQVADAAALAATSGADATYMSALVNEVVNDTNQQLDAAATARGDAESAAANASTQLSRATATLGYVQDQATQVAAQATYFGIEQARIGTLSAGAVVIPPGTLTPELLLPTLTGIAQLRQWQPTIIVDAFGVEMVEVPRGCFMMGSVAGGDEQPVSEQCFDAPFTIDRYEVTQRQFTDLDGVMSADFAFPGKARPVENINWFDARDFCLARDARLPTEREWEYAARGPDSLTYPWGNVLIAENVAYNRVESQGTADVVNADGSPARPGGASWVGALDLSGNVFEWTSTRYDDLDYSQQTLDFQGLFPYPYRPDDGRETDETREAFDQRASEQAFYTTRVVRGGSWSYADSSLRGAARNGNFAGNGDNYNGFRCARSS